MSLDKALQRDLIKAALKSGRKLQAMHSEVCGRIARLQAKRDGIEKRIAAINRDVARLGTAR